MMLTGISQLCFANTFVFECPASAFGTFHSKSWAGNKARGYKITTTTVLQPFVWDYLGEPLPEETSGYATWFTAGGAIRIAHYDVIDDIITRTL